MSLNASEARLGALARKTFLSMWSYENPFYEQGKELCDVLVVLGDDVIIISDKLNRYGDHPDSKVNWQRWYRKAVAGSIRQLRGARNHITRAPQDIYTDAQVSSPFPLRLPPVDQMRIHLIAVANGCEDACTSVLGRPSLRIDTRCKNESELLTVGAYKDDGDFVHVISRAALDAIFDCFDTARDFIDYLDRKKDAIAREDWVINGEENLVAAYMLSQPGNQPFNVPVSVFPIVAGTRTVPSGIWSTYANSDERQNRQKQRRLSYVIDALIEHVADEYKTQSLVIGQDEELSYHEQAFRLLASESRLSRQAISAALYEIYKESTRTSWSAISISLDSPGIHYVWLLYPQPPSEWDIDAVEEYWLNELSKYMLVTRLKFPLAKRIFGICLPHRDCTSTSRLFRVMDGETWTDEMQRAAQEIESNEKILSNIETFPIAVQR